MAPTAQARSAATPSVRDWNGCSMSVRAEAVGVWWCAAQPGGVGNRSFSIHRGASVGVSAGRAARAWSGRRGSDCLRLKQLTGRRCLRRQASSRSTARCPQSRARLQPRARRPTIMVGPGYPWACCPTAAEERPTGLPIDECSGWTRIDSRAVVCCAALAAGNVRQCTPPEFSATACRRWCRRYARRDREA